MFQAAVYCSFPTAAQSQILHGEIIAWLAELKSLGIRVVRFRLVYFYASASWRCPGGTVPGLKNERQKEWRTRTEFSHHQVLSMKSDCFCLWTVSSWQHHVLYPAWQLSDAMTTVGMWSCWVAFHLFTTGSVSRKRHSFFKCFVFLVCRRSAAKVYVQWKCVIW